MTNKETINNALLQINSHFEICNGECGKHEQYVKAYYQLLELNALTVEELAQIKDPAPFVVLKLDTMGAFKPLEFV